VFLGQGDLDLLPQDLGVEQVLDADSQARRLVGVAGADSAPRGPDLQLPEASLGGAVERDVPGHDQMGVARDAYALCRDVAALEVVELLDEHPGVDDAAGAEHALLAGEDPRRHVPQLVRLAVDDDRVPGVRPALVATDNVRMLREEVDDLPFALVAPLRANDHGRGHETESAAHRG